MMKKAAETPETKKGSAPSLAECMSAFDEFLRLKDLRMTEPRKRLIEKIFTIHDHFDADDLLFEFRRRNAPVSRATIYRTLELLAEAGLVEKTSFNDNKIYYEFAYGHDHHDHLICKSCGKIIEFHDETIEARQEQICRKFDFTLTCHSHKIYGLCADCRRKGASTS